MKTKVTDLTGEKPVNESLHDNIANVLHRFDECTTTSRYGDAIESLIALFADKPKGKPIEFHELITDTGLSLANLDTLDKLSMDEITRIAKNYCGYDVMLADYKGTKLLYLGHWNDGYVEGDDN